MDLELLPEASRPSRPPLRRADLDPDPITQFERWHAAWRATGPREPDAVALATADEDGRPSARMVLLKAVDARGFVFYSNAGSCKGRQLAANPWAALLFFWPELDRQVRAEGTVERLSDAESDVYFATRPRASQMAAWASPQSAVLVDRAALEARLADVGARFDDAEQPIPRPPYWGGYRVRPTAIEFWQGRPARLHDRFSYRRADDGTWSVARLAP